MTEAQPRLRPEQVSAFHTIEHRHLLRIPLFIVLYAIGAGGAIHFAPSLQGLALLALVPLYLLAAASLHGISLFTHEGVHGVLSENRFLNDALSAICAWPVLQNFAAYRVLHLRHHKHLGAPGDPDHYQNYTQRKWLVFGMHWGRLLFGYPAYVASIPVLAFRQGGWRDRIQLSFESLSLLGIAAAILLSGIPAAYLVHGWLIPMCFIHFMVNVRGMSQHTLLEQAQDQVMGTRSILTNPVTAFFMCNENYHLEHHIYPGIPWYHLPKAHAALKPQLEACNAPLIPSYAAFVREFVSATFTRKPAGTVDLKYL
jgi:fatty acid desaturase